MRPVNSYARVCEYLIMKLADEHRDDFEDIYSMIGLLFARPKSKLTDDEIIPHLDYFNLRTGNHIDIFCGGYEQYWGSDNEVNHDEQIVAHIGDTSWLFRVDKFDNFRREIENLTRWHYSGGVDLILTNAIYKPMLYKAELDFSSAIVMNMDRAKAEGAILSVEMFMEQLCQYVELQSGIDPTWGFSDKKGVDSLGSALKNIVIGILPKEIQSDARHAFHFIVEDIRR